MLHVNLGNLVLTGRFQEELHWQGQADVAFVADVSTVRGNSEIRGFERVSKYRRSVAISLS